MNMRLYHHKTDGGAEYLCTAPIEGTDEGDLRTTIIRIDGETEFLNPTYSAAPELLEALEEANQAMNAIMKMAQIHDTETGYFKPVNPYDAVKAVMHANFISQTAIAKARGES